MRSQSPPFRRRPVKHAATRGPSVRTMSKVSILRSLLPALLTIGAMACNTAPPTPGLARGEALWDTCVPCHGAGGAGNQTLGAPAIAGMEQWYLESQLKKFQAGHRGYHHEDAAGLRMRPMARSLELEGDVASVAEYVAKLPKTAPTATVQGDATAGQASFATCAACHGQRGEGNQAMNAPALNDKSDWYLVTQLSNFKHGLRGAHPDDTTGATMRPMAGTLADDTAIQNVVAYIGTLK